MQHDEQIALPGAQPERRSGTETAAIVLSFALMAALAVAVILSNMVALPLGGLPIARHAAPQTRAAKAAPTLTPPTHPAPVPVSFDPSQNAPLPNNRLILFYGIADSGLDFNGPASLRPFTFLPHLQALGRAYTKADPAHPARVGVDVVVNIADRCQNAVFTPCSHFVPASVIQSYIDYCQAHNLYLFLDLQFGRASVRDVVSQVLPYLQRYPFVELALDTEFHFYTPDFGVPSLDLGYVDAFDINWVINQLAQIPMRYHVPRKVLMIHQWFEGAIHHKEAITITPLVSVVVHPDGFGSFSDKLWSYHHFVKSEPVQYGGMGLFLHHADCPSAGCAVDTPQWSPQQVLSLTPAPLVVTYE